jgi:hypothetical protein
MDTNPQYKVLVGHKMNDAQWDALYSRPKDDLSNPVCIGSSNVINKYGRAWEKKEASTSSIMTFPASRFSSVCVQERPLNPGWCLW